MWLCGEPQVRRRQAAGCSQAEPTWSMRTCALDGPSPDLRTPQERIVIFYLGMEVVTFWCCSFWQHWCACAGFTGQLVCEHLARDYGSGQVKWAMAGRSKAKLEGVRKVSWGVF